MKIIIFLINLITLTSINASTKKYSFIENNECIPTYNKETVVALRCNNQMNYAITDCNVAIGLNNSSLAIIESLNGIEELTSLEKLNISGHLIEDITPLKNLKYLKILNISSNKVKDIPVVTSLTELPLK